VTLLCPPSLVSPHPCIGTLRWVVPARARMARGGLYKRRHISDESEGRLSTGSCPAQASPTALHTPQQRHVVFERHEYSVSCPRWVGQDEYSYTGTPKNSGVEMVVSAAAAVAAAAVRESRGGRWRGGPVRGCYFVKQKIDGNPFGSFFRRGESKLTHLPLPPWAEPALEHRGRRDHLPQAYADILLPDSPRCSRPRGSLVCRPQPPSAAIIYIFVYVSIPGVEFLGRTSGDGVASSALARHSCTRWSHVRRGASRQRKGDTLAATTRRYTPRAVPSSAAEQPHAI
jgi:hypothetical protein